MLKTDKVVNISRRRSHADANAAGHTRHRPLPTPAAKLREAQNDAMMSAAASSLPSRGRAAPFRSRALRPSSPWRRAALRRQRVLALGGDSEGEAGRILDPRATPLQILGLDATARYSAAQLKAAFRARVLCLFRFLRRWISRLTVAYLSWGHLCCSTTLALELEAF